MAPRSMVSAAALACAAAACLSLAPGARAQFTDNVTGYVSGGDLLSSAQCRVVRISSFTSFLCGRVGGTHHPGERV
jgi:hypothetical protein